MLPQPAYWTINTTVYSTWISSEGPIEAHSRHDNPALLPWSDEITAPNYTVWPQPTGTYPLAIKQSRIMRKIASKIPISSIEDNINQLCWLIAQKLQGFFSCCLCNEGQESHWLPWAGSNPKTECCRTRKEQQYGHLLCLTKELPYLPSHLGIWNDLDLAPGEGRGF